MDITVTANGVLELDGRSLRCALGRGGVVADKTEGDGATPAGCYRLRRVLYRGDRIAAPDTALPVRAIGRTDGWCDDPGDPNYNGPVALPYPASAEALWREDAVYDLILIIGHNDDPPVPGAGSAVFVHVARPDYGPTEGCVALAIDDLRDLLAGCSTDDRICIRPVRD